MTSRSSTPCRTACSDSSLAALALSLASLRKYFTTYKKKENVLAKFIKEEQLIVTHHFKGVEADFSTYVAVLVEAVLGERAALEVHAQFHEEPHDVLVDLCPHLTVFLAVDDIV